MAAQDVSKPPKEKELVSWSAPVRPFKKYSREVYVTIISAGVLFGFILFLIDGILPVLLLVAVFFLFYVLSNTNPETYEYKITNFGIRIADSLTPWENLGRFWFVSRFDSEILVVESNNIAGRIEIVLDKGKKEDIRKTLEEYLTYEKISPSMFDKAADWVGDKFLQHGTSAR